jgi:hypothetical protein
LTVAGSSCLLGASGCLGSFGRRGRPDVECEDARRPTATTSGSTDVDTTAAPTYPDEPPPVDDVDDAVEYATEFERAYRYNAELERNPGLDEVHVHYVEANAFDAPPGAVACRLRYEFSTREERADDAVVIGDDAAHASYYLDASVVVRTAARGLGREGDLGPDPWRDGRPVACFGATTR